MSDQTKAPCFAADGKEPVINAGFGYPLMVSAVAFNRQHSRIEADEALMRTAVHLLKRYVSETPLGNQPHMITMEADSAITALRKRLESSK